MIYIISSISRRNHSIDFEIYISDSDLYVLPLCRVAARIIKERGYSKSREILGVAARIIRSGFLLHLYFLSYLNGGSEERINPHRFL